jgi:hypothetical protein
MKAGQSTAIRPALRAHKPWLAMVLVGALLTIVWVLTVALPDPSTPGSRAEKLVNFRAFTETSYWNTPLPMDAPTDPNSDRIIAFLKRDNAEDHISLAGAGLGGQWGNPIYVAEPGDPTYSVVNTCADRQPPEFRSVRIPRGAAPDPTSDASMTVYDLDRGIVYGFFRTDYEPRASRWLSCGGTVYYLESNGLDGILPQSDNHRNFGHRGLPPSVFAVRHDEIQTGSIDHVLKIAVNHTKCESVFPMTDDECGTRARNAPPEGARIRLKPSIDLSKMGLSRPVLIIARALQRYGAIIGDQSGEGAQLKLQNTVAEGRGQLWRGVLQEDSLSVFSFSDYQIVQLGYAS